MAPTVKELKDEIGLLTLKSEAADQSAAQTLRFFEESVKLTEKFWAQFRWLSGAFITVAIGAIGIQVFQSYTRLTDAVASTKQQVSDTLTAANERISAAEKRADDSVSEAIAKLSKVKIDDVQIANPLDNTDVLFGYADFAVQTLNGRNYGVAMTITFNFNIGFTGTGVSKINGIHAVGSPALLNTIFGDRDTAQRQILAAGHLFTTDNSEVVPNNFYMFNVDVNRNYENCSEYNAALSKLAEQETIGTIDAYPVFQDAPNVSKPRSFKAKVVRQSGHSCEDVWQRISVDRPSDIK